MARTKRVLASSILLTLAVGMAALGAWQLQRMDEKRALIESFDNAPFASLEEALAGDQRFSRVRVTGRFDPARHVLLDNKILRGQAGVHVFTPFTVFNGTTVLVNRGWKPMSADRSQLPDIPTPTVPVELNGMLAPPPEHRQRLGEPDTLVTDRWPQLVTYLDLETVAAALDTDLPDRVVWLAADHEAGFEGRDWSPATVPAERHRAYAIQWFALSVTALVIWLGMWVRGRRRSASDVNR